LGLKDQGGLCPAGPRSRYVSFRIETRHESGMAIGMLERGWGHPRVVFRFNVVPAVGVRKGQPDTLSIDV
jgi:hypothetical protein